MPQRPTDAINVTSLFVGDFEAAANEKLFKLSQMRAQ
jgi:hypothetical protein